MIADNHILKRGEVISYPYIFIVPKVLKVLLASFYAVSIVLHF